MIKKALMLALVLNIAPMEASNITDAGSASRTLESIYKKNKNNPMQFERDLDNLYNEVTSSGKIKEVLDAIKHMAEHDANSEDMLHKIYSDVLMLEDVSAQEKEAVEILHKFSQRLEDAKHQSAAMSIVDFKKIQTQSAGNELISLSMREFKQSLSNGACVLYSFIYAATRLDSLKNILNNILYKDNNGNYYIVDIAHNKSYKITPENIRDAPDSMHPSKNPVLRALGLYAFSRFKEVYHSVDFSQYVLAVNNLDIFFGKPLLEYSPRDFVNYSFNKDGTLKVGEKVISGEFVVSMGTTFGGGHAIAAYYNKAEQNWKLFDNIAGKEVVIDSKISGYTISNVLIIGNHQ